MATTFVIIVNHWAGKYELSACHATCKQKGAEYDVAYELQVSNVGARHVIIIQHTCAGARHGITMCTRLPVLTMASTT
jgi:NAD-dependent dihydropyrimidine dehydrogenase PreA subunit